MKADNYTKYLDLREKYPVFSYERYFFQQSNNQIALAFEFSAGERYVFRPEWTIQLPESTRNNDGHDDLDAMVFHIGLIEMMSYWKAFCSPSIRINAYRLTDKQQDWCKKLFRYGLGEFFYTNSIPQPGDDLFRFNFDENAKGLPSRVNRKIDGKSVIVPVGGGKDSIVGLELLKDAGKQIVPFVVNPRKTTDRVLKTAGFTANDSIIVHRSIDPLLLNLNNEGFLNGHTPFSALLAFGAVLVARLSGIDEIALSNESSANEASIPGTKINHQYSKSVEFESDFRNYIDEYICGGINYFSILRPLNELQISAIFARFKNYHPVFRSCNVGSKQDVWCCKCSKCLFTFVMLSSFLHETEIIEIFGCNLFDDEYLLDTLEALSGIAPEKPFECVGTLEEVNVALCHAIQAIESRKEPLPALLAHYRRSSMFEAYRLKNIEDYLGAFNEEHFVPDKYVNLLNRLKNH